PGTPLRFTTQSAAVVDNGTESHPLTSLARVHLEQDIGSEYYPSFVPFPFAADPTVYWDKFFWRTMGNGAQFSIQFRTPGIDPTQRAYLRVRSWGVPVDQPGNCTTFYPQHLLSAAAGDDSIQISFANSQPGTARLRPLLDTLNVLRLLVPLTPGCGIDKRID